MKKTLSILLTAIFLLTLTFGATFGAMADDALSVDKFTKTEGADDMSLEKTASGIKLKSTGTYEFEKQFTYTPVVTLGDFQLKVSAMNVSSTATEQTGQGGNAIFIHAAGNSAKGLLIEQHYNVFGNTTGRDFGGGVYKGVYDTEGNVYYGSATNNTLFWGDVAGVPKNDFTVKIKKSTTDNNYVLTISTTDFGNKAVPDSIANSISVNIPADKIIALFGADLKAQVAVASYFQPTPGVAGEAVLEISEISPLFVEPNPGDGDDDDDDTVLSDLSLVEKVGSGTIEKAATGLKVKSSGTFEFEEGFKLKKAYKADGFGVEFTDMNIGASAYNIEGQGGLKIVLSSAGDSNKAIIIEQHFNVFGNTTGKIIDSEGNEYHSDVLGIFWAKEDGGVPKSDLSVKLKKLDNGDYQLSISTKSLGKMTATGDIIDIGEHTLDITIPADKFKAIFGSDPVVAMSFMPYYQKPANTPSGAEMVLSKISGTVQGENTGGDNGNGSGNGSTDGGKKPTNTGEVFPVAISVIAVVSILSVIALSKKRHTA